MYHLTVDTDTTSPEGHAYRNLYRGSVIADAMAAWSKAVSDGEEYVMLEALREEA
jgi:hypothetical protein